MSIKSLKKILDEIEYPVLIEIIDCIWYENSQEFHWNLDDNQDDLENGDGMTYSMEITGDFIDYGGYRISNGDTGCGETVTYFFNLEKEAKL